LLYRKIWGLCLKDSLIEKEGKATTTKIIYKTKDTVIHNTVAHHTPTDAQQVGHQNPHAPQFIVHHDSINYGTSPWPARASCPGPAPVPSQLLLHPQPLAGRAAVEAQNPRLCASTALQKLKYQCAINILLILNPKHRTMPAIRKKINSILAETRTISLY